MDMTTPMTDRQTNGNIKTGWLSAIGLITTKCIEIKHKFKGTVQGSQKPIWGVRLGHNQMVYHRFPS